METEKKEKIKNFLIAEVNLNNGAAAEEIGLSLEDYNNKIISSWNEAVGEEDQVFVFGDFIKGKVVEIRDLLARLNGKVTLCSAKIANDVLPNSVWEMFGVKVYNNDITYFNKNGTTYYYSNSNKNFDCKNSKIILSLKPAEIPFYCENGDRYFSLNAKMWDWNPINLENIVKMVEE